jgi:glycyl-tRNA synthetase beta chain
MDRELLLEVGCEELPASWLPGLTHQIGEVIVKELRTHRLALEAPAETFSTPRRLTVRIARLAERQTDLEELVTGPPVSASFGPGDAPLPAASGFAAKHGVEVSALERVEKDKGVYLAYRRRQRGKPAIDVLPDVLAGTLRGLTFPKLMHWDAELDEGRELLFGRPIRWLLYLYGGRVVPFTISRQPPAHSSQVQEVASGASTYGHRFLTTSGRAGRAIKVRTFDEYKSKLLENFVILEREERHNKIARELDAKAQRLQARVSRTVHSESYLLQEVPDLVEYPSVIAGTFGIEFLELPTEVLTTTLIHHQHYFPVEAEDGRLKNAFLAVINTETDNERIIARNSERVVTARLRDARFFWESDRKSTLESKVARLATLVFHKKLGTYLEKSDRIARLARWIARDAFGASDEAANQAAVAARLAKADLTTDMVREFTELQGTMGGIYAREEGQPEAVWKAIYHHYQPAAVESDAPPTRSQLADAALTWAAVSLADKLDTVVGLFAVGEKPTGSRDPYGVRRAAQGIVKVLTDLQALTIPLPRVELERFIEEAYRGHETLSAARTDGWRTLGVGSFLWERKEHLLERRGFKNDEIRVVSALTREAGGERHGSLERVEALSKVRGSADFQALAALFKRVKNITKGVEHAGATLEAVRPLLREPAEIALADELSRRWPTIDAALRDRQYVRAMQELGALYPPVDRFFTDVLVMAEEPQLRQARLGLLAHLRGAILNNIGDIAEIAIEPT